MPHVTLRSRFGESSESDLVVEVKQNTFDYLLTSTAPTIRVSTYLDRDWPRVEPKYAELHVEGGEAFESRITRVIPGSRTRPEIELPGPMQAGEQLTLEVRRVARIRAGDSGDSESLR